MCLVRGAISGRVGIVITALSFQIHSEGPGLTLGRVHSGHV